MDRLNRLRSILPPQLDAVFRLDLRSLALFRIALAALLIIDIFNRWQNLSAHYTDWGAIPRNAVLQYSSLPMSLSLYMMSGHWTFTAVLFSCSLVISLLLALGYRTRLMTILAWLFLISLHARAPIVLQGGDDILRLVLLWAIFLPLGARYSIDSLESADKGHLATNEINHAATAAYMLQIAFIYWFTVILKDGDEWFPDLTAVYYALHLDQFATRFGIWLRQFTAFLPFLTASTLFIELFAPFLWFMPFWQTPLRLVAILSLSALHLSFGFTMHIGLFPFIDIAVLLPFLPSGFWHWLSTNRLMARSAGLQIYYDGGCGFCRRLAAILKEFLLLQHGTVSPAAGESAALMQEQNSWVVKNANGTYFTKTAAMAEVWRHSPLLAVFAPLLRLPAVARAGDFIYGKIADNRHVLGPYLNKIVPHPRKIPLAPNRATSIVLLSLLAYVTASNIISTRLFPSVTIPQPLHWVNEVFKINQNWSMFAPFPAKDSGWYAIRGTLQNQLQVDVWNQLDGDPGFTKPDDVAAHYRSQRWRKYLLNIRLKSFENYRLYFGRYLCRLWNESHDENEQLYHFDIYYVRRYNNITQPQQAEEPSLLWQHFCFD